MSSYFGQLTRFDPLSGNIPDGPIPGLSSIAYRARQLLKSRSSDEIHTVAKAIDFAIYCFFDELKQNEIQRLRRDLEGVISHPRRFKREPADFDYKYEKAQEEFEKYFEWDGGTVANGQWLFKESMESDLDIRTPENTSELEALKECKDWWHEIGDEGFPKSKPYELFAVLSLWMMADALEWPRSTYEMVMTYSDGRCEQKTYSHEANTYSWRLVMATESALKAMEAICYAEQLQEIEKSEASRFEKELAKQESERKERSMRGQELNIARHQKRNEAQARAIQEWEKEPNRFPSAEKAGLYLADWLGPQGFQYEPRTVTTWVRSHAKKIGIKFR